jgi:uncharacterized metal-binding protein YceD (DUF177 family)
MTEPAPRWHVPVRVEDVPETGLHLDLAAAPEVRSALAALAGVRDMPRLDATVDLVRQGSGLRATGRVAATVGQDCVVTLDPVESEVDEPFDVVFAPQAAADAPATEGAEAEDGDPPEALIDGTADLGAILADLVLLGIDRYPRKPGAEFAPPADASPRTSPFAALAKLKDPER